MQEKQGLKKLRSSSRSWNILRLALLWARKGGVLKNKIGMDLSIVPKYLKRLGHGHQRGGHALHYGERELSFDDTPIIHIKMHRPASLRFKMPHIPCINPHVDFNYDFDLKDYLGEQQGEEVARKSFLKQGDDESCGEEEEEEQAINNDPHCDDEIDLKAEKFIAKFYDQMKLQRQISYLQYNEMLNTSVS